MNKLKINKIRSYYHFHIYGLQGCTDLARDDETLIVFSTLGGGLTAIHPITSEIVWTIVDGQYKY